MSSSNSTTSNSDTPKIPKLQNSKGFAIWRIYVRELLRKDNVLHVLTETPPNPETSNVRAVEAWKKSDLKARPHLVLNLGEEPATLVTSLLLSDASTKQVWERLCEVYQRENIQSQLNLRAKLQATHLSEDGDIQQHLTQLEQIFVDLARINDPVLETEKSGHLLRSLPPSLSFIAIVVQANNMGYTDLCSLLTAESERRKQGFKPVVDSHPPVTPAARLTTTNNEQSNPDVSTYDMTNVFCWYCGKRGHMKGQCRLRQRRNDFKHSRNNPRRPEKKNSNRRDRWNSEQGNGNRYRYQRRQDDDKFGRNEHQARGFMTRLKSLTTTSDKFRSTSTWLDCGANEHFIWDRKCLTTTFPSLKHL